MPRPASHQSQSHTPLNWGILPLQSLQTCLKDGVISADEPPLAGQVQPASLDLRLGRIAYRVQASFLPGRNHTVQDSLSALEMHAVDLDTGAVLERGCVYIVPLQERLALPEDVAAIANPKSSSGRLDIFTRLITDHAHEFDRIRPGYHGPLYAEIAPRTFSILVRPGDRLSQLRLRRGDGAYTDLDHQQLHARTPLVHAEPGEENFDGGVAISVDLQGTGDGALIGYKARRHTGLIDLRKINHYDPNDFWEPIQAGKSAGLILNPDDFYILASREAVCIPPDHAAEMMAYDTLVGEFRVHYAGFFDPGFGDESAGGAGTRAVLEVRSHDVPFLLNHGQIVGRLVYAPMLDVPAKIYGRDIRSNYQGQTLALAKQFRRSP